PIGKTVNFTLHTKDVIHSFWVPALAGKRDLISNHTNYLWYTPDSVGTEAFNGACVEYCGTSHANMRFKAFTVTQADFDSWIANQLRPAVGTAPPAPTVAPAPLATAAQAPTTGAPARQPSTPSANVPGAGVPATAPVQTPVAQA